MGSLGVVVVGGGGQEASVNKSNSLKGGVSSGVKPDL